MSIKNSKLTGLDLDLIRMTQEARMIHDDRAKPSQITAVYWIETKRKQGDYPAPTARSGEWRVQTTVQAVDELWERIKEATITGRLGHKSKVSTCPAKGQVDPDARLICARTYDGTDERDKQRVYQELVRLNISELAMKYHFDHE